MPTFPTSTVGMKPRWQFFFTKKIIPEIDELFGLVDKLRLRERVAELGSEFQCFIHTPGPDGAARTIEHLRPTLDDVVTIPRELIEMTGAHRGHPIEWRTEADRISEIVSTDEAWPVYGPPQMLWFQVKSNWDDYTNTGTLEPWWRIGNLKKDSTADVIRRYLNDDCLGLETNLPGSPRELALSYGDPKSLRIYDSNGDLSSRHLADHCQHLWKDRRRQPFSNGLAWNPESHCWHPPV